MEKTFGIMGKMRKLKKLFIVYVLRENEIRMYWDRKCVTRIFEI